MDALKDWTASEKVKVAVTEEGLKAEARREIFPGGSSVLTQVSLTRVIPDLHAVQVVALSLHARQEALQAEHWLPSANQPASKHAPQELLEYK